MSDTVPTNPAPETTPAPQPSATAVMTPPATAPAPAPAPAGHSSPPSLAPVRTGFACILAFFAIALLGVALVYFAFPQRVQSIRGVANPSWRALFGQSAVWPGGLWSL